MRTRKSSAEGPDGSNQEWRREMFADDVTCIRIGSTRCIGDITSYHEYQCPWQVGGRCLHLSHANYRAIDWAGTNCHDLGVKNGEGHYLQPERKEFIFWPTGHMRRFLMRQSLDRVQVSSQVQDGEVQGADWRSGHVTEGLSKTYAYWMHNLRHGLLTGVWQVKESTISR